MDDLFCYLGDMTGAYSLHSIYEGHEIMFHVSTLLPYSKDNKQQVSDFFLKAFPEGLSVYLVYFTSK